MRIVIQRVKYASCTVDGVVTGKCDKGLLLFIGFKTTDTEVEMDKLLKKVMGIRIFEDENQKMNKSLMDINGTILAISQFTLYAVVNMEIDQALLMLWNLVRQVSIMIYFVTS